MTQTQNRQTAEGQSSQPSQPSQRQRLRPLDLAAHGFMAFPLAFAGLPIYLHAPEFYAGTLGLPLATLGGALLALRAIDALQDPLIGTLSDRFHRHRPAIIVAGALLLAAGFWMLFHPAPTWQLAWFSLSVFICTTGFSIVSINLQAAGGLWVAAAHERTRITSWREAFGLLGLVTAAIGPTVLGNTTDPERAFHLLTLFYLPLLAAATWILLRWLAHANFRQGQRKAASGRLLDLLADPWRRLFFGIFALNTFASAVPAVLVLFFIQDRLQAKELSGLFLLIYFLSGVFAMPLWQVLSRRLGKIPAWGLSMALSIVTFFWATFVGTGQVEAYAAVCALSGLALGADLALPPSILADHIEEQQSHAKAARLYALMTLLSKGALALATGLALPLLGLSGYQPGIGMTPQLAWSLSLAYAALPCMLKLCTLALLLVGANRIASPQQLHA
ncbi:MFS transporter [Roseibium sp.]|uniref:MFS transporter n=1 Tax=Roseibium sp. TaxID=1936156 RepID=UPI003A96BE12